MNSDAFSVRVVVVALAVIAVGGGASLAFLAFTGTAIPDQLDRLVTGAVGALVGILAATRTNHSDPTPVQVTNQSDDPVPVEPTGTQ